MDSLAAELRRKFAESTPHINHIVVVDPRCIRVDYSTPEDLQWLEIWSDRTTLGMYVVLTPERLRKPLGMSRNEVLIFMKSKFVLPEKETKK